MLDSETRNKEGRRGAIRSRWSPRNQARGGGAGALCSLCFVEGLFDIGFFQVKGGATPAALLCRRVVLNGKVASDQLLGVVHLGALDHVEGVWVHNHPHPVLLKDSKKHHKYQEKTVRGGRGKKKDS